MSELTNPNCWSRPDPSEPRALRRAFGAFATGVTVVATRLTNNEIRGFTANSFSSVSMTPPLVSVCLGKFSASLEEFQCAPHFSVSILEESQRDLSNAFASRDQNIKIDATTRLSVDKAAPYLSGSLATFICSQHAVIDAGDHIILIGRVEDFSTGDGSPLGFFRGGYVGLGPELNELDKMPTTVTVGGVLGHEGKVLLYRTRGAGQWHLPAVTLNRGERHAHAVARAFEALGGIKVNMTFPYSLFQETNAPELTLVFAVEADVDFQLPNPSQNIEVAFFSFEDAPWKLIEGEMKQSLLQRYLRETASGNLGVYFDTSDGGSVIALDGLPRAWSDWASAIATPTTSRR